MGMARECGCNGDYLPGILFPGYANFAETESQSGGNLNDFASSWLCY